MPVYQFTEFEWPFLVLIGGVVLATAPLRFILKRSLFYWILLVEALLLPFLILIAVRPSLQVAIGEFTPEPARENSIRLEAWLRPWFVFAGESSLLDLRLPAGEIETLTKNPDAFRIHCRLWMHNGGYLTVNRVLDRDTNEIQWKVYTREDIRGGGSIACSSRGEPPKWQDDVANTWDFEIAYLPAWLLNAAYVLMGGFIGISYGITSLRLWRTARPGVRRIDNRAEEGPQ